MIPPSPLSHSLPTSLIPSTPPPFPYSLSPAFPFSLIPFLPPSHAPMAFSSLMGRGVRGRISRTCTPNSRHCHGPCVYICVVSGVGWECVCVFVCVCECACLHLNLQNYATSDCASGGEGLRGATSLWRPLTRPRAPRTAHYILFKSELNRDY